MYSESLELRDLFWIIIPLLILQIGLILIALWDWYKKRNILGQNKMLWLLLILFLNTIGPIIYLVYNQRLQLHSDEESDDWEI